MTVTLPPIHDNQEWKQWLAETFNINNAYKSTCPAVSLWAIWHNMNKYYHEGSTEMQTYYRENPVGTPNRKSSKSKLCYRVSTIEQQNSFENNHQKSYGASYEFMYLPDQQRLRSDNLQSVCMPSRSCLCRRNGVWQCNHRRGFKNRHKKAKKIPGNDRSIIRGVINEIKEKSRNFWNIVFHYVPREANGTAHAMAAWGRGSDSSAFWVEETPLEVEPIVLRDQGRSA
ncbi:hypothetical protein Goari_014785 [Gossypium aridum]|uniref:RNase H type-1 domain-containing protein n=1 Tax=Gossypium aridum TaxID=34290 RepID=A0A7J8XJ67_GOSAI|nr:hypothetical protein [Gossypium aridum]